MQLRATFTLEVYADDLSDAAEHQRRLEEVLVRLRAFYPDAELVLTERRRKARLGDTRRSVPREITGRVHRYADVDRA